MKAYIAIIIPVVLVIVVFTVGYVSGPMFESPKDILYRQIDEKVELAQRVLDQYNPAAPHLLEALTPSTTQPAQIDGEQWRDQLDPSGETDTADIFSKLRSSLDQQMSSMSSLDREFQQLGGEALPAPPVPSAGEALDSLKTQLQGNEALLAEARQVLEEAIGMSEGEGEAAASGDRHPEATRLLALVIHAQADMYRRQAALRRAAADRERDRFARFITSAHNLDRQIESLQQEIRGGAPAPTRTAPAADTETEESESAVPAPAPKPAAKPPKGQEWWILGKLFQNTTGAAPGGEAQEPVDDQAAQPQDEPKPEPVPEPVKRPEFRPPDAVPALNDRIADLQRQRAEVLAGIEAAETEVARLNQEVEAVTNRMRTAQAEAAETQKKMMALEQEGVDPAVPGSVQPFIERYNALSAANRQASREAAILEHGAVRNARPGTDDIEEILRAPLVQADPDQPMEPVRGLTALTSDLATTKALFDNNKTVLAEIDRQLADLAARQESVAGRMSRLQAERQELTSRISESASTVLAAAAQAGILENKAVDLAKGAGLQAAQRARTAASEAMSGTKAFIVSENPQETPDRKLSDMAADQFPAAHIAALEGDLHYLIASTLSQQATGLERHRRMLEEMEDAGVPAKLDPAMLGEEVPADSVPMDVTNAGAVAKATSEALTQAAAAGKAALESYKQAADQLKDMWVVHASIAAVHNLLADLPRAADDPDDHLAKARQTYERAIRGRETRPEYPVYRRIAEDLAATTPPAK